MLKRISVVLAVIIVVLALASCKNEETSEKPDLTLPPKPTFIAKPEPGQIENDSDWKYDDSGYFRYIEYEAEDGVLPVMEPHIGCPDNVIIYSTDDLNYEDRRYGYMDLDFKILTPPINRLNLPFVDGYCMLYTDDYHGLINRNFTRAKFTFAGYGIFGEEIVYYDFSKYSFMTFSSSGISPTKADKILVPASEGMEPDAGYPKTGFKTLEAYMDTSSNSEYVIEPKYIIAGHFKEGMCPVVEPLGENTFKLGFIDEEGNLVIDYQYSSSYGFDGESAIVTVDEELEDSPLMPGTYIIDKENNVLAGPYLGGEPGNEGFWFVYDENHDYSILNNQGIKISNELYKGLMGYSDGITMAYKGSGITYVNSSGTELIETNFKDTILSGFREGKVAVRNFSNEWGYINDDGSWFIKPKFYFAGSFYSGFALVSEKMGKGHYLIDEEQNKYLVGLGITEITRFNEEGYAIAKKVGIKDGDMVTTYFVIQLLP